MALHVVVDHIYIYLWSIHVILMLLKAADLVVVVFVVLVVNVVVVALLLVIDHIIFTYDQWKGIFHGRSSSRECCDPAKLTFNQRLSSNKGCLLLKVIFH